jgi:hypothetical protein
VALHRLAPAQFGLDRATAQQFYRRFVAEGVCQPSPWQAFQGQILLGHPAFVEAMQPRLQAACMLSDVPRTQRYADRPALETLFRDHQTMTTAERNRRIVLAYYEATLCCHRLVFRLAVS